jgi:hypothetical protein
MTKSESIGSTHPITHIKNSIKRALDHDAERGLKTYCGGVFIDYLGILMESYANQVGIRQEHYYMCLRNSIQVINKTIAQPHNCITLIVHQLSGKANSFEPGIIADHSHGAGNRSFGENVDFCFQGSKVDNNGLGVFGCTKHREAAPKHPVVIRICGDTCRLEQAQGYKLDSKNHIVIGT